MKTNGVHHVGLTVDDLAAAQTFFVEVLGFEAVGEKPEYPAVFVRDAKSLITLWQAVDLPLVGFNRRQNVGLHHLALSIAAEDLDALYLRLKDWPGVSIEFAPEPLGKSGLRHMMSLIPGGIRLELVGIGGSP
ncbi:MAG: VOC family protein [Acidobacteria bacterium]|nr:VOC family protein [Acidobacteriota bacterium]